MSDASELEDHQDEEVEEDDELFDFCDDEDNDGDDLGLDDRASVSPPWQVLIVDDEESVHRVTKLALGDLVLGGRAIEFSSVYSAAQAKEILRGDGAFAVILLDVVMESDDAGLQVVGFLREKCQNLETRIILRTGQPGEAPERDVIVKYDINGYRAKADLTDVQLFSTVVSALRNYADIKRLADGRRGLQNIIEASGTIFGLQSFDSFAAGILTQLMAVVRPDGEHWGDVGDAVLAVVDDFGGYDAKAVLCGTGRFSGSDGTQLKQLLGPAQMTLCEQALQSNTSIWGEENSAVFFCNSSARFLLFLCGCNCFDEFDRDLIAMYCNNVAVSLSNIERHKRVEDLTSAYSHFAPIDAVQMLKKRDITDVHLGDCINRSLAILFLDIRSFVALTQTMRPNEVLKLINSYLHHVGPIIENHRGLINKYTGDGFMAFFGHEGSQNEDAIACAATLLEATGEYNRVHRSEVLPEHRAGGQKRQQIRIGIGINRGEVIAGTVGYSNRYEFTVLGETVNLAARLENLSKLLGTRCIVHDNVASTIPHDTLPNHATMRKLPRVEIRGLTEPVSVWEVMDPSDPGAATNPATFDAAVTAIDTGHIDKANAQLSDLNNDNPQDSVVEYYLTHLEGRAPHQYSRAEDQLATEDHKR